MESKEKNHPSHTLSTVMNLPETKCIQVFINGDEHFPGCRCVVNYKYYRSIDMFLNYLTERLKPSFGAVRNIYTPVNGHSIINLEDLNNKHRYVVAGKERFKKLDVGYSNGGDKVSKKSEKKSKNVLQTSKARPDRNKSLNIWLYKNGHFKVKSSQVTLSPPDLVSWELTYKKIVETLNLGPIKRLCTLDGKPLWSIQDLANNQSYVIVGKHEVFKSGPYGIPMQHSLPISKNKHMSHESSKKSSVISTTFSAVDSCTSAQSVVRKNASAKFFQVQRQDSTHDSFYISDPGNGVESDSFCPPEPDESRKKIDFDDDFSGIFRSKVQNHLTAGAVEIEDSPETVVDIPVDLLDAEEVEDEVTPDVERSLQHLSLDVPDKIIAYLPNAEKPNSNERQVPPSKYSLNHSHSVDVHNILV